MKKNNHDFFKKILKDCFTEKDNATTELTSVLLAITVIVFLSLSIWDVYLEHDFKPKDFGTGFGLTLGSFGAARWLKKDTENEK